MCGSSFTRTHKHTFMRTLSFHICIWNVYKYVYCILLLLLLWNLTCVIVIVVGASHPPPSSPPPISRLLLILLPALLANSLWRRKTAAWHLLRFSVVDFCYFNVLGFPFSFPLLSFPLLCSALLGIASRSYLFPFPSARIMKTSSTKVVWVILLAASPVRLFGCLVKMKGISLLFFVTPCFSVFLHFVGYSFLNVCVRVFLPSPFVLVWLNFEGSVCGSVSNSTLIYNQQHSNLAATLIFGLGSIYLSIYTASPRSNPRLLAFRVGLEGFMLR